MLVSCLVFRAAFALAAAGTVAAPKPFTLAQVIDARFASDLVASPAGGRIAWVADVRGVRNVWLTQPPDYKGRAITSYQEDDGQEIAELRFTPDGKSIMYVRGGDFEGLGDYPNPMSVASGVEQDVWIVGIDGRKPRKIGEGHSPAVSPNNERVAYVSKKKIWEARLDGKEKPVLLVQASGESQSLRWSPDGSMLAFVSSRGTHSFVGIYDTARRTVRYLDPSADNDSDPAWSPDGKRLAFLRNPSTVEPFRFDAASHREDFPWSIRVADARSGIGKEVFRADPGRGSVFHSLDVENQLLWGAGSRLVFPWEKDGWVHLYSIPVDATGAPVLLTPGDFEVLDASLSNSGDRVLFSSNQGDIERRHLWRVPISGGSPEPLTTGAGIEWSPVAAGGAVCFLRSDVRHPAQAAVLSSEGPVRDSGPDLPSDFPADSLVEPQPVTFSAADGMAIHGQLFLPPSAEKGLRKPALLFFHGGPIRQMLLGFHYMDYYSNAYAMNQFLASRGYVVLAVNYRSGIGYGLDFREALGYGASGASEFNDVLGAAAFLRGRSDVDPKRIGLWGGSYGGYLTALGLARASDVFAAGVDLHGVHDWNTTFRAFYPGYDAAASPELKKRAFESSPLASVKTWRAPVLLIHGDDDRNVPFTETIRMAEALRKQNVDFEELILPDEIHGFLVHSHWLKAYGAEVDFFDRHLMSRK